MLNTALLGWFMYRTWAQLPEKITVFINHLSTFHLILSELFTSKRFVSFKEPFKKYLLPYSVLNLLNACILTGLFPFFCWRSCLGSTMSKVGARLTAVYWVSQQSLFSPMWQQDRNRWTAKHEACFSLVMWKMRCVIYDVRLITSLLLMKM